MLMAFDGDPVGIRTLDLLIRSQSLYPAELPLSLIHISKLADDVEITVKGNPIPYVGRGGLKLEKAIDVYKRQA